MIHPQLHNSHNNIKRGAGRAILLLGILLVLSHAGCKAPEPESGETETAGGNQIVLRDAMGEQLRLRSPATRVISLAPNLTEMVFAIGGGDLLVGRSTHCNYPPEVVAIEPAGDMLSLNYETILTRKADLILMTFAGNSHAGYRKLKELGLNTFVLSESTVQGVINTIDTVGILLGRTEGATRVTLQLRKTVDSVRTLVREGGRGPVTTFVVIDKAPLMSASSGFLVETIEIAGGENIAREGATAYPLFSREELLRRDPEVILLPGLSRDAVGELLKLYPEWRQLRAVRENHVYVLPPDIIFRPGPRIGLSLELLYKALHGADPDSLLEQANRF